ncbi:hypothetical protein [Trujillonella humicola]|uniref:hypothetical protein n=1 Tax=Trujillonella humicola TaxID=3383699 RepID=UPI003905E8AB
MSGWTFVVVVLVAWLAVAVPLACALGAALRAAERRDREARADLPDRLDDEQDWPAVG